MFGCRYFNAVSCAFQSRFSITWSSQPYFSANTVAYVVSWRGVASIRSRCAVLGLSDDIALLLSLFGVSLHGCFVTLHSVILFGAGQCSLVCLILLLARFLCL